MALDSQYIYVSGIAENELLFTDTDTINVNFGIPDSFGQVYIQDISTSFGFNSTPHTVELSLVAEDPINISEDKIGEACAFKIGAIRFYGYVTHVDSSISSNGYITRVSCEDGRKLELNKYLIHTEPLLDSNLSNVIVVPKDLNTGGDLYKVNSPLWLMSNYGATYAEIYYAVMARGFVNLPNPGVIANRLGNSEAYRWSFSMTPLFDALLQIFDSCGYDVYYYKNEVRLIDRGKSIAVTEAFLDAHYKISFRGGYDQTDRPTIYTILGAKKEGGVGTVSGVVQYENLVDLGSASLQPAWNDIEIHYHDNNGYLKRYKPTDDELKMALKSIEHWVFFKKHEFEESGDPFPRGWMESRIDPFPYGLEGSQIEAALSFGGGRSDVWKVIRNRRAIDCNWLVQWYDAVSRHARTYYGKLYYCEPSADFLRKCMVIDSAWVDDNVDNRSIPDDYSPFYSDGKIRAFARFNKNQVLGFGLDGTATPASYTEWNEVGDNIYVPITPVIHSPTTDRDALFPGITNTRLFVSLPEIVVSGVEDHPLLTNLSTLSSFERASGVLSGSGILEDTFQLMLTEKDFNDPRVTIIPFSGLESFFIPIQYNIRYGDDASSTAGSGGLGYYGAEIDDKFAPWTKQNPEDPVPDMASKALQLINNDDIDRFLEAEVTGLPEINFFANFSNEDYVPVYPFTSINVSIGTNGLISQYSSKTQLKELIRLNKIEWSRFRARLERIQHYANLSRMNTDLDMNLEPQLLTTIYRHRAKPKDPRTLFSTTSTNEEVEEEEDEVEQKSFVKAVEIVAKQRHSVTDPNGGPTAVIQELYQGLDDQDNVWPPNWFEVDDQTSNFATTDDPYADDSQDTESIFFYQDGQWIEFAVGDTESVVGVDDEGYSQRSEYRKRGFAPCQDGYLRTGMMALYHQEDINGTVFCYFTGGVSLEDARMGEIVGDVTQEGDYLYADVKVLTHTLDKDEDDIIFRRVPFASAEEAAMQGYGNGSKVPLVHNKMVRVPSANSSIDSTTVGGTPALNDIGGVRPEQTFFFNGQPQGGLYIPNPPVVGAIPVTVITPPDANGEGGVVAALGQAATQFGASVDDDSRNAVSFVGCDPEEIYAGDYGILTKGLDQTWYCFIMKPMFTAFGAFETLT